MLYKGRDLCTQIHKYLIFMFKMDIKKTYYLNES